VHFSFVIIIRDWEIMFGRDFWDLLYTNKFAVRKFLIQKNNKNNTL